MPATGIKIDPETPSGRNVVDRACCLPPPNLRWRTLETSPIDSLDEACQILYDFSGASWFGWAHHLRGGNSTPQERFLWGNDCVWSDSMARIYRGEIGSHADFRDYERFYESLGRNLYCLWLIQQEDPNDRRFDELMDLYFQAVSDNTVKGKDDLVEAVYRVIHKITERSFFSPPIRERYAELFMRDVAWAWVRSGSSGDFTKYDRLLGRYREIRELGVCFYNLREGFFDILFDDTFESSTESLVLFKDIVSEWAVYGRNLSTEVLCRLVPSTGEEFPDSKIRDLGYLLSRIRPRSSQMNLIADISYALMNYAFGVDLLGDLGASQGERDFRLVEIGDFMACVMEKRGCLDYEPWRMDWNSHENVQVRRQANYMDN